MNQFPLIDRVPDIRSKVHPADLIAFETPLHPLTNLRNGRHRVLIKREDQTDSKTYGGNKVRNLEFVLGEAVHRGCDEVTTLIAYGSNFTAALAAQSKKLGLKATLSQFVMEKNSQIVSHVEFGKKHDAGMTTFDLGPFGLPMAAAHSAFKSKSKNTYFIAPGASSVLGALGHANALLEMVGQVSKTRVPAPDRIIVGAGTCGTIAGLIVGAHLSREKIRISGVRCADSFVCNHRRVIKLANQTLQFLGVNHSVSQTDFDIFESPGPRDYAKTSPAVFETMTQFEASEGIPLDSTYTSKVMMFLNEALLKKSFEGERLLYWHTFSPNATQPLS